MAAGGTLICRSVILLSDSGKPITMGSPAVRSRGPFWWDSNASRSVIWVSVAEHCRKTGIDDTRQVRHRREKIRDVLRCGKKAIPHQGLRKPCFVQLRDRAIQHFSKVKMLQCPRQSKALRDDRVINLQIRLCRTHESSRRCM